MGYDNHFTGAITITPPLTWAEIRNGPGVSDARIRIVEETVDTETGQNKVLTGDAIVPLEMGTYSGHSVAEDIQTIVDHYGARHAFAGYIQVQWDPGFDDPIPQRYVVVNGHVETVTPELVWPGESAKMPDPDVAHMSSTDALLADARAVALLCRNVLKDMPIGLGEVLGVDYEDLPDWFTGDQQGRLLWGGGVEDVRYR